MVVVEDTNFHGLARGGITVALNPCGTLVTLRYYWLKYLHCVSVSALCTLLIIPELVTSLRLNVSTSHSSSDPFEWFEKTSRLPGP